MRYTLIAIAALTVVLAFVGFVAHRSASPAPSFSSDAAAPIALRAPSRPPLSRVEARLAELRAEAARDAGASTSHAAEPVDAETLASLKEAARELRTASDPDDRVAAIRDLRREDHPVAVRALLGALADRDADVRAEALDALADVPHRVRAEPIIPLLHDADAQVRYSALSLLGDIRSPAAHAAIRSAQNDPNPDVKALANGLVQLNDSGHNNDDEYDDRDELFNENSAAWRE